MMTITDTTAAQIVLGRYSTAAGPRWLHAHRQEDHTVITDEPVSGDGPTYWVDTIPDSDGPGAITALAHVYLQDARDRRSSPMSRSAGALAEVTA